MASTTAEAPAWLACSCCGRGLLDTPEENASHGQTPSPHDVGVGMCVPCGGDRKARGTSEKATRRRLGWAGQMFYDARIKTLTEQLAGDQRERFLRMPYARKCEVIARMIERGKMI